VSTVRGSQNAWKRIYKATRTAPVAALVARALTLQWHGISRTIR